MAIRLEFQSIIIPIVKIEQHYPGGFKALVDEHKNMFGGKLWHDTYLFRDGAMTPDDMCDNLQYWQNLGLEIFEVRNNEKYWKDVCVIDYFQSLICPCEWIELDIDDHSAYLKGTDKGNVIGREEMLSIMRA